MERAYIADYKEFLANLKAGDDIFVSEDYGRGYSLSTVERLTATQIVIASNFSPKGRKFSRRDGYSVGGAWTFNRVKLLQPTKHLYLGNSVRQVANKAGRLSKLCLETSSASGMPAAIDLAYAMRLGAALDAAIADFLIPKGEKKC